MRVFPAMIALKFGRPAARVAWSVSGGFHALLLAGLAWTEGPSREADPRARLVGQTQVFQVEVHWATALPSAVSLSPTDEPVVLVQPDSARIEKRRFVLSPTRVDLPEASLAVEPAAVAVPRAAPALAPMARVVEPPTELRRQPLPPPRAARLTITQRVDAPGAELDVLPSFRHNRPPRYPEEARRRGWQGTVLLRLTIDATGEVTEVRIAGSSGFAVLDAEAVNTVRQWRAEPARRQGRAVATEEILPIRFSLAEED